MDSINLVSQLKLKDLVRVTNLEEIYNLIRKTSDDLKRRGLSQWDQYYTKEKIKEKLTQGDFYGLYNGQDLVAVIHISKEYPYYFTHNTDGEDGSIMDYTQLYSSEDSENYMFISALGIDPAFQGMGLGSLMLEKIEDLVNHQGVRYLRLDCRETGYEWLPEFYRKYGYIEVGRMVEEGEPTYLIMEKDLLHT